MPNVPRPLPGPPPRVEGPTPRPTPSRSGAGRRIEARPAGLERRVHLRIGIPIEVRAQTGVVGVVERGLRVERRLSPALCLIIPRVRRINRLRYRYRQDVDLHVVAVVAI